MTGEHDDDTQEEHHPVDHPGKCLVEPHVHDEDEHDDGNRRGDKDELPPGVNGRVEDELVFLVCYGEDVEPSPEHNDTVQQYGNPIHAVRYLLLAYHLVEELSLQHVIFNHRSLRFTDQVFLDHEAGNGSSCPGPLACALNVNRNGDLGIVFRSKCNEYGMVGEGIILYGTGLAADGDVPESRTVLPGPF